MQSQHSKQRQLYGTVSLTYKGDQHSRHLSPRRKVRFCFYSIRMCPGGCRAGKERELGLRARERRKAPFQSLILFLWGIHQQPSTSPLPTPSRKTHLAHQDPLRMKGWVRKMGMESSVKYKVQGWEKKTAEVLYRRAFPTPAT